MIARLDEFAHGYAWWVTKEGVILAKGWHENHKVAKEQLDAAVEQLKGGDEDG